MSDEDFLDNIRQNLASETERMCEDIERSLEESVTDWSRHYWRAINRFSSEGRSINVQKFANICAKCKTAYRKGNAISLAHQRKKLCEGDERLILQMELCSTKDSLTNWRLEKRAILCSFYDKKAICDQEVVKEIESLVYRDFI